jgi:magnesium-protoporphyrin IX monomethyl ester (oxidative) cyclase
VFHKALGVDPTDYDYEVFRICNEIARQVFPVELDIDDPQFRARMEALRKAADRIDEGKAQGGIGGWFKRATGAAGAGYNFARMYFHRTRPNTLPATIRLQPAW